MGKFQRIFLRGLVFTLPLLLTFTLFVWLVQRIESLLAPYLLHVLGEAYYFPGLGLTTTFLIIMLSGVLLDYYVTAKLANQLFSQIERLPFIKAVYGPIKDLFSLLGGGVSSGSGMQRVVKAEVKPGFWMIGLVTRETFDDIEGLHDLSQSLIAVYFPSSFMFGGHTLLVERDKVEEISVPTDRALKLAITGWIRIDPKER
jgi:uncharacterized membrane protein